MVVPAYVPQIGDLLKQGVNYDMAVSEEVTHSNELTRHPIEDPTRSFIYDHNREQPTEIRISLIVSTDPLIAGESAHAADKFSKQPGINHGIDRLTQFQEQILAMRAAQSVGTSAYFDVYTGLRVYRNMGIESLSFKRDPETPNTLTVELSLVEFRFARPPRSEQQTYHMDANDGPRSSTNAILVDEPDRPVVEATRARYAPRMAAPTEQTRSVLRSSIQKLPSAFRASMGITLTSTVDTAEDVNFMLLDDTPSQRYTLNFAGEDHDILFNYNQIADRWSFTAGLSGDACPKIGGWFIEPGFNLYASVTNTQMLAVLDRPGITTNGLDWYARLTMPLSDGIPATMLAVGSVTAFNGLFRARASLTC